MSLANKVNGGSSTVAEGINTKEIEYFKAKELLFSSGPAIVLKGFFIQSGKYGESITLIAEKSNGVAYGINVPGRYVDRFKAFTPEEVEDIKAGKLGIKSMTTAEYNNTETVNIEFCDL